MELQDKLFSKEKLLAREQKWNQIINDIKMQARNLPALDIQRQKIPKKYACLSTANKIRRFSGIINMQKNVGQGSSMYLNIGSKRVKTRKKPILNHTSNSITMPATATKCNVKTRRQKDVGLKEKKALQQKDNSIKPIVTEHGRRKKLQSESQKANMHSNESNASATIRTAPNTLKGSITLPQHNFDEPVATVKKRKTKMHSSEFKTGYRSQTASKDLDNNFKVPPVPEAKSTSTEPTNRKSTFCSVANEVHVPNSETKMLLDTLLQNKVFSQTNISNLCDANVYLSSIDMGNIRSYLKHTDSMDKLDQMQRIINFINQHNLSMTNCILGMRALEVNGYIGDEKYNTLHTIVKIRTSELSKIMQRGDIKAYMDYVLWVYERRRLN